MHIDRVIDDQNSFLEASLNSTLTGQPKMVGVNGRHVLVCVCVCHAEGLTAVRFLPANGRRISKQTKPNKTKK